MGFVTRSGSVSSRATGEPIGNSFAVGEDGGVYIVTDAALYRFQARRGDVRTAWRAPYPNVGVVKPTGRRPGPARRRRSSDAAMWRSPTTPTRWPVRVYQRRRHAKGGRLVCREPVFERGTGATDQSLIGAGRSLVVENNFGYTGIASTLNGATNTPGLDVDLDRDGALLLVQRGDEQLRSSVEALPGRRPRLHLRSPSGTTCSTPGTRPRSTRQRQDTLARSSPAPGVQQQLRAGLDRADGTAYVGVLGDRPPRRG